MNGDDALQFLMGTLIGLFIGGAVFNILGMLP